MQSASRIGLVGLIVGLCVPLAGAAGNWNISTIDSVGTVGEYVSMAVFPASGYPAISYFDATAQRLKYAEYNGTSWGVVTLNVLGNPGTTNVYTSLAILPSGQPAISYYDYASGHLRYTERVGTTWQLPVTVDSGASCGSYNSLAIVGGRPAISYYDLANKRLKYVQRNANGTWGTPTIVDSGGEVGSYTSLAVLPSGQPAIAYCDGLYYRLKFAWFDADLDAWQKTTIDTASGSGLWTSLTILPDGQPAVTHWWANFTTLRYVKHTGTSYLTGWQKTNVDSGNVGEYSSLGALVNGRPVISYYDSGNGALKFAWSDGTDWHKEAVDTGTALGQFTSLRVLNNGAPAIAYFDGGNGDLKYAVWANFPDCDDNNVPDDFEINLEPSITQPPVNTAACVGSTATFEVVATGAGPLHYQWYLDGAPVGGDAPSYTTDPVTLEDDESAIYVVVTGPCGEVESDEAFLFVQRPPTADAGEDQTVCAVAPDARGVTPAVQLAGSAADASGAHWTTSGDGHFDDATSLTAIYWLGLNDMQAGEVTLILHAHPIAPCAQPALDMMVITVQRWPVVDAGPGQTVCATDTVTLAGSAEFAASTLWITGGDGTFDDATRLDAVYTPGPLDIDEGGVMLELQAMAIAPCEGSVTQSVIVLFQVVPTATAGPDQTVCEYITAGRGGALPWVQLNGAAGNAASVLWTSSGTGSFDDASLLNAVYTLSADDVTAGSVTLTLTASAIEPCTAPAVSSLTVNVQRAPTVDAGADQTVCAVVPPANASPLPTPSVALEGTATNYSTVEWVSSGSGTFDDSSSLATTYHLSPADVAAGGVTLTLYADPIAPCTNTVQDALVVTMQAGPTADAGPSQTIIAGETATMAGAATGGEPTWSTLGDGTFSDVHSLTAIYTPGAADIAAGQVLLSLTVVATPPCTGSAISRMMLTITPTGACCFADGHCEVTTEAGCSGTWQGAQATCDPNPCPQLGACCYGDSCEQLLEADCSGTWRGAGTSCDACQGACCANDGSCSMVFLGFCEGSWLGYDVTCDASPCPLAGACCYGASCDSVTEFYCGVSGGTWRGAGADCPTACQGACCVVDGSCTPTLQADCGANWLGYDSVCDQCPQPGACCFADGHCEMSPVIMPGDCAADGTYLGDGTSCTPSNPCPQPPGACCYPDGTCSMTPEAECTGVFQGSGVLCGSVTCPHIGDTCEAPLVISLASLPYVVTDQATWNYNNNYADGCLGAIGYASGADVIYQLDVPADMCINVIVRSRYAQYIGAAISPVCPPAPPNCVVGVSEETHVATILNQTLVAGTYYLMLDSNADQGTSGFDYALEIRDCAEGAVCCYPNGSCAEDQTLFWCRAFSGTWHGGVTACADLQCPQPVTNDTCDTALPLSVPGSYSGDTTLALVDETPECNEVPTPYKGVWFTVVGTGNTMTVSTCDPGTAFDTMIQVFCDCPAETCVTAADDDSNCGFNDGLDSTVSFCSYPGHVYTIIVGGYDEAEFGPFVLNVTDDGVPCTRYACAPPPPNDDCTAAEALTMGTNVLANNSGATDDLLPVCGYAIVYQGMWYKVTGTGNTLTVTTCNPGTSFDTAIQVFCDCPALTCVDGNDDDCTLSGSPNASTVRFCSLAGHDYYVAVGGYWVGYFGQFELSVTDDGTPCTATTCWPVTTCPGDANCDGQVNFADIDLFVAAIPDNEASWRALFAQRYGSAPLCPFLNNDISGDGHVNFADIDPFVALIPSTCADVRGACCVFAGYPFTCVEVSPAACEDASGTWQGAYTLCGPNPCASPLADLEILYETEDPAPDTNDYFECFWDARINDMGVVAFMADLYESGQEGIWRGDDLIALDHEAQPGGFWADFVQDPTINDHNVVAYAAGEFTHNACGIFTATDQVDVTGRTGPFGTLYDLWGPQVNNLDRIMYVGATSVGEVILRDRVVLLKAGDPAPGGGYIEHLWSVAHNEAGQIVWRGSIGGAEAICTPTQVLARVGAPGPLGSTWTELGDPQINRAGVVYWWGQIDTGRATVDGIFTQDGALFKTGDLAPNGMPYVWLGNPNINASGRVMFAALVYDTVGQQFMAGVFTQDEVIAFQGQIDRHNNALGGVDNPVLSDTGWFAFAGYGEYEVCMLYRGRLEMGPLGACCYESGGCAQATQAGCTGTWLGEGATCEPNPCTQPPAGACCVPDGTCYPSSEYACVGFWQGAGTSCDTVSCPVYGACCFGNGTCAPTVQADCSGAWLGAGTNCIVDTCPPSGSCCPGDGSCYVCLEVNCTGTWNSGGICDPGECPTAAACCFGDGHCETREVAACAAAGGAYQGDGVSCDITPCAVQGACCTPGCAIRTPYECAWMGGVYFGDSSVCDPMPCPIYDMNLLLNPGAELGDLRLWSTTGPIIVDSSSWGSPHTGSYYFVTSNTRGAASQLIDLLQVGFTAAELDAQPPVQFDLWSQTRLDCGGGTYEYGWRLEDANYNALAEAQVFGTLGSVTWAHVARTFTDYGSGLRYLRFLFAGQDTCGWAGYYGTQFDDASVMLHLPEQRGACCGADGNCAETLQPDCTGTWQGLYTKCASVTCPQPQVACCLAGFCSLLTAADCTAQGGTPQAYPSTCDPNPCPLPENACLGDADCDGTVGFSDIDYFVAAIPDNAAAWAALYAERHGGAAPPCLFVNCDVTRDNHVNFGDIDPFVALIPSACQPPITGACCLLPAQDGVVQGCYVLTPAECAQQGGTFLGLYTGCVPDPCVAD